ncbi:MAG: pyridoxal 5'-phosphate synthase glutaminase subunit PdxT [Streptosporangiaceae bacterium]
MTPSGPVVGVLALQGDVREHRRMLERCGAVARPVRRPGELVDLDGIVIPGGESTTMSRLMLSFGLLEPLRDAIRDGMAAYGSCAGMIMLADKLVDGVPDQQTLGGIDVVVRRNAFGRQIESFETGLDVEGVDGPAFHAVFIRAPWVESVGGDVEVLGRVASEGGSRSPASGPAAGRIVAVRQGRLLATSFHPELTGDDRIHRLFLDLVRERAAQVDKEVR